jgi:hypothetical protein
VVQAHMQVLYSNNGDQKGQPGTSELDNGNPAVPQVNASRTGRRYLF